MSLLRCLLVGLIAGVAAVAVTIPLAAALQGAAGRSFPEQLGAAHLAQACLAAALLGAVAFYALARSSRRPLTLFAIVTAGFAIAYSVVVAVRPPSPGFAEIVAPLHVLVAAVTIGAFALAGERVYTSAGVRLRTSGGGPG